MDTIAVASASSSRLKLEAFGIEPGRQPIRQIEGIAMTPGLLAARADDWTVRARRRFSHRATPDLPAAPIAVKAWAAEDLTIAQHTLASIA